MLSIIMPSVMQSLFGLKPTLYAGLAMLVTNLMTSRAFITSVSQADSPDLLLHLLIPPQALPMSARPMRFQAVY